MVRTEMSSESMAEKIVGAVLAAGEVVDPVAAGTQSAVEAVGMLAVVRAAYEVPEPAGSS